MKPQLLIGSVTAKSGKTTFMMGLLRVLSRREMQAQSFKCGPDYFDNRFHNMAAENESVNLDTWMASKTHVQYIYNKYGEKADVCITEGMAGLFDGYQRMRGSSAEIAGLLKLPVILVVNAHAASYSVAAFIYGFKHFSPAVKVVGVVFNRVTSPSQFAFLRDACLSAGVECLGYIPELEINWAYYRNVPWGMSADVRVEMNALIDKVADQMEKYVDVEKLLNICQRTFPCQYTLPYSSETGVESLTPPAEKMSIAIARDSAFNLIYKENADRLSELGKITYFSPVYCSKLPEADLIYIPGGTPWVFARQLHRRRKLIEAMREYAEDGGKILAEGEGLIYLAQSMQANSMTTYTMTGILPFDCNMIPVKPYQGYRRIKHNGMEITGYEFRTFNIKNPEALASLAKQYTLKGLEAATPLYRYKNVIAGYTHFYWGETNLLKLWDA
ncbi:cobyrinate a,c-diamide synthase [Phocaeicola sp.]|uniref:cobyrinate a,c-diamide synthase n=1 Tax=Phocaeicola sp. TaxID=2773926 RepID=UPI0023C36EAB|nr:cobyrinate a,c-diamide synthase [Phocaeicola sp.]MDE5676614.1 cobyrinate a,c-diamide synthase [Phocaeicola sp.]